MVEVDQLIMIIPVVLNLKGNLEMNLSARLGTAANIGQLDDPSVRRKIILGNLSLLQVQATVVSFVAACVSIILGLIVPRAEPEMATRALFDRRPRPSLPLVTERKSGLAVSVISVVHWHSIADQCPQFRHGIFNSHVICVSFQYNTGLLYVWAHRTMSSIRTRSR